MRELTNIMNEWPGSERIPEDWKNSTTTPIYKSKDAMECAKQTGVRLLEHGMKVYEDVLEKRLSLRDLGFSLITFFTSCLSVTLPVPLFQ